MGLDVSHDAWHGAYSAFTRWRHEIAPEDCARLADRLEGLLAALEASPAPGLGHIERAGGFVGAPRTFIAGCRAAAALGEPLEFH